MRGVFPLLVVLGLAGALTGAAPAVQETPLMLTGEVTRVLTGDTLEVRLATGTERFRLIGVAAPASRECFASQATAGARQLALGRQVTLLVDRAAPASRRLAGRPAYVALPGGADLGRRLVAGGHAQIDVWGAEFARFASYVPAQQAAQDALRGLWGACSADLSVSIEGPKGIAVRGSQLTYTVTLENNGPLAAPRVSLTLRPPASAELVSADSEQGECRVAAWRALCSFASTTRGHRSTSTFVLKLTQTGIASVRASASFGWCVRGRCAAAPVFDSNRRNDESAALANVVASAPPPPLPGSPPPPPFAGACHPSYPGICLPPPPPDLDCADIPYRDFQVRSDVPDADPHDLDGDDDGIGCQFNDY